MKKSTPEHFMSRFKRVGTHLLWQGFTDPGGYGRVKYQGKLWGAHVLSFVLHGGILLADKIVCHRPSCNLRNCGEPSHLYAGTYRQNNLDQVVAGTHAAARMERCKAGHVFEPAPGWAKRTRICRVCRRGWAKKYRAEASL